MSSPGVIESLTIIIFSLFYVYSILAFVGGRGGLFAIYGLEL